MTNSKRNKAMKCGSVRYRGLVVVLPDMQGSGAVRDLREAANDGEWRVVA